MAQILSVNKDLSLDKPIKKRGSLVLAGGCFDILHPGHVVFLEKAKEAGDILVIILESDEKVKKLKGKNRPVHNQKERAQVLAAIQAVDYVVMLPFVEEAADYDRLIKQINPDIIALTIGTKEDYHQRVAKLTGAKLKYVTKMVGNHSSSRILKH